MGKKSEFLGLWNTRQAWYQSKALTKKQLQELPKKVRVIMRYNKYHKGNDSRTPKFVFSFADAETAEAICFKMEDYTSEIDEVKERLETIKGRLEQLRHECECVYSEVYSDTPYAHCGFDHEDIANRITDILGEIE